jgi:hypothetical protein
LFRLTFIGSYRTIIAAAAFSEEGVLLALSDALVDSAVISLRPEAVVPSFWLQHGIAQYFKFGAKQGTAFPQIQPPNTEHFPKIVEWEEGTLGLNLPCMWKKKDHEKTVMHDVDDSLSYNCSPISLKAASPKKVKITEE